MPKRSIAVHAGTRPPKNGISALAQRVRPFEVKIISAPAVIGFAAGGAEQIRHPPRDRGRRIDPVDRPWREPDEPVHQQRIMGAGQHDGVGARRIVFAVADKARREFGRDIAASLTSPPLNAASASEARSAEPTSVTSQPCAKSRISALVYSRLTVPLVPSTETRLVFDRAQAGLIAGTVPTKGTV